MSFLFENCFVQSDVSQFRKGYKHQLNEHKTWRTFSSAIRNGLRCWQMPTTCQARAGWNGGWKVWVNLLKPSPFGSPRSSFALTRCQMPPIAKLALINILWHPVMISSRLQLDFAHALLRRFFTGETLLFCYAAEPKFTNRNVADFLIYYRCVIIPV